MVINVGLKTNYMFKSIVKYKWIDTVMKKAVEI